MIITDFRLQSTENGIDLICALRESTGRKVPAILVTGDISIELETRADLTGLEVLYKPVDPKVLLDRIRRLINNNVSLASPKPAHRKVREQVEAETI